jgi:lipopolysaccharide transport system ATP-binding protein
MSAPFFDLKNACVDYPIYGSRASSLKTTLFAAATGGRIASETGVTVVRALRDLTFSLRSGDRLGVVGHNGAGKSTLLRLLAGVYLPTAGTLQRGGTIASLIDPALGIEPEATGYENIYLRGLLMGLRRVTIRSAFDDLCAFSGLGDYLGLPVRTYSTGMLMRLAFSIATCVRSDIILMDEWLSVGDAMFQEQAEARLRSVVSEAGILVLASHSEALIRRECNKLLRLDHGSPADIISLQSPLT